MYPYQTDTTYLNFIGEYLSQRKFEPKFTTLRESNLFQYTQSIDKRDIPILAKNYVWLSYLYIIVHNIFNKIIDY